MHSFAKSLCAFASMAGLQGLAAQSDHAVGLASAEVVRPLTVTREADLDFGVIVSSQVAGTLTITARGVANRAGGARQACCSVPHAAKFWVDGQQGRSYTIHVPSSVVAHGEHLGSLSSHPPDLAVDNLTVSSGNRPDTGSSGVLDSQGTDWFGVGGTLHIPSNVPPAYYNAIVPVMVSYD